MSAGVSAEAGQPLLTLLHLAHRAREAANGRELAFLLVNDTRTLLPYRQAVLWWAEGGVHTLSGVVQAEANTPYAQWLARLCAALQGADMATGSAAGSAAGARRVTAAEVAPDIARDWAEWLPAEAVWLPLRPDAQDHQPAGGLLLAGDTPLPDEALALLDEWGAAWQFAWWARHRPSAWSWAGWRAAWRRPARGGWWRWRPAQIALALALAACLPVRLSTLAQGELVPIRPAVIRAPLDGVVDRFHVQPNQTVKAGDPLFSFDEAALSSRLDVARQALATAELEYRQAAQQQLSDARARAQVGGLLGRVEEKRVEVGYLAGQLTRAQVRSPQDGVAIVDDPSEWIGRPLQTGERVMRVADPQAVEIEVWLPVADAIPLQLDSEVALYLTASPLASIGGRVRSIGHDALPRPDGSFAYRIRATVDDAAGQRIGLKGTAKLHGERVSAGYWVLRRPLAAMRQFLGL